jgi:hypothetical protein
VWTALDRDKNGLIDKEGRGKEKFYILNNKITECEIIREESCFLSQYVRKYENFYSYTIEPFLMFIFAPHPA